MRRHFTLIKFLFAGSFALSSFQANAQTTLYSETFNHPVGQLPPGWVIDAEQAPSWGINESQIAGGEYPELYMNYGFQAGLSRLISSPISVQSNQKLALKYNQYLINYDMDWGETVALDITFDGGNEWIPLWEKPLGNLNIPQERFAYYFTAPEGATELKFAFRYDGNNYAINGWAIDDILVEAVRDNDLVMRNMFGSNIFKANEMNMLFVEVENGGTTTQTNYTIDLINENGDVLATAEGTEVNFGEKSFAMLAWTPTEDDLGQHVLYAKVNLTGDQDPSNDVSKPLYATVFPADMENVQIQNGSIATSMLPYSFFYKNSISQTIYKSDLIGNPTSPIIGIQYTCQFDENHDNVPIQIYFGETDQTNVENGWVNPQSFTKVYDNGMSFYKGYYSHYIPLDQPYQYNGGNLVIYSNKAHSEPIYFTPFISEFNMDIPPVSRLAESENDVFDPMSPPDGFMTYYMPNITLFFADGTMAVIDQSNLKDQMSVYPNPANNFVNIKSEATIKQIVLVNALGQQVLYKTTNAKELKLDVQNLASGVYVANILTEKGIVSKKILVK